MNLILEQKELEVKEEGEQLVKKWVFGLLKRGDKVFTKIVLALLKRGVNPHKSENLYKLIKLALIWFISIEINLQFV